MTRGYKFYSKLSMFWSFALALLTIPCYFLPEPVVTYYGYSLSVVALPMFYFLYQAYYGGRDEIRKSSEIAETRMAVYKVGRIIPKVYHDDEK
jgi:hypothetical protein